MFRSDDDPPPDQHRRAAAFQRSESSVMAASSGRGSRSDSRTRGRRSQSSMSGKVDVSRLPPAGARPRKKKQDPPPPRPSVPKERRKIIDNGWGEALNRYEEERCQPAPVTPPPQSFKPDSTAITYNPVTGKWQDPDAELRRQEAERARLLDFVEKKREQMGKLTQTRYNILTMEQRADVTPREYEPIDGDPVNASIYLNGRVAQGRVSSNQSNCEYNIISGERNRDEVISPAVRKGVAPSADKLPGPRHSTAPPQSPRNFDVITGERKAQGRVSSRQEREGFGRTRPAKKQRPQERRSHDLISGLPVDGAAAARAKPAKISRTR